MYVVKWSFLEWFENPLGFQLVLCRTTNNQIFSQIPLSFMEIDLQILNFLFEKIEALTILLFEIFNFKTLKTQGNIFKMIDMIWNSITLYNYSSANNSESFRPLALFFLVALRQHSKDWKFSKSQSAVWVLPERKVLECWNLVRC